MKTVYKGIFLERLRLMLRKGVLQTNGIAVEQIMKKAGFKKWNVYAKSPFGSIASVIEYLGRYSHNTAITKHRIAAISDQSVTFRYKEYSYNSRNKEMTLSKQEFTPLDT